MIQPNVTMSQRFAVASGVRSASSMDALGGGGGLDEVKGTRKSLDRLFTFSLRTSFPTPFSESLSTDDAVDFRTLDRDIAEGKGALTDKTQYYNNQRGLCHRNYVPLNNPGISM